ncbi:MAG: hypothetical protein WC501_01995 [Candidatus Micrarchaeia archaeon]
MHIYRNAHLYRKKLKGIKREIAKTLKSMKDIPVYSIKLVLATMGMLFLISTFNSNAANANEESNEPKKEEIMEIEDVFCYQKDAKKPSEISYTYEKTIIYTSPLKKTKIEEYYNYHIDFGTYINNEKILGHHCNANEIILLGEKNIYLFKIEPKSEKEFKLIKIKAQCHSELNEYMIPGGEIVGSDVYYPANLNYYQIPFATITRKGFFHVEKMAPESWKKEQFQMNLAASEWELGWPDADKIKKIKIKIISPNEFLVLPVGTQDSSTKRIYLIIWPDGKEYSAGLNADVFYMEIGNIDKNCRTILDASEIVYDEAEGGWHTIITYITNKNEIKQHSIRCPAKKDVEKYLEK